MNFFSPSNQTWPLLLVHQCRQFCVKLLLAKTMLLFLSEKKKREKQKDQPAEARHCSVVCYGRFHNEELSTSRPGRQRTVRPQPTQRQLTNAAAADSRLIAHSAAMASPCQVVCRHQRTYASVLLLFSTSQKLLPSDRGSFQICAYTIIYIR